MAAHVSAAADPWYSSALFWAIFAAIATLLGTAAGWVVVLVDRSKRRLLIGIRTATPIVTAPEELRTALKIVDGRTRLTEPWFVEIELVGRGRKAISERDFGGHPIRLTVGGRIVKVLTVRSNEPSRLLPAVEHDATALQIGPDVIGRRQHIVIPLLTDGSEPKLEYQASFSDVKVREAKGDELVRSRISRYLRAASTVSIGLLFAVAVLFATPAGRQYVLGVDHGVELYPICSTRANLDSPPSEVNAAYHYHCVGSSHMITPAQIAQRCQDQWPGSQLALRDADSAAGWKCHVRGLLK